MIQTEKLSRRYGEKLALAALDLRVEPGEILGFLGPNGAGKSTTVKILTGMIRPDAGRAIDAGFDRNGSATCPKPARCTKRCRPTSISS